MGKGKFFVGCALCLTMWMTGCGGGGGGGGSSSDTGASMVDGMADAGPSTDTDDGTDPDSSQTDVDMDDDADSGGSGQPPTASFQIGGASEAGKAATFDASGSTDPEGEPLTYHWDFGDSAFGGGEKISHIYGSAGHPTVELTVTDPDGNSDSASKMLKIDTREEPLAGDQGALTLTGTVTDTSGKPLTDVDVSLQRGSASAKTDSEGKFKLEMVDADRKLTIVFDKDKYAEHVVNVTAPSGTKEAYIEPMLIKRSKSTTLDSVESGATASPGTDGVGLELPPNALVDASGNRVSGKVDVTMTPVDISTTARRAFPGSFSGIEPDGSSTPILSYGASEFELQQQGKPLQLAPGKSATVTLPIYSKTDQDGNNVEKGDTFPLWSFDASEGIWVQEGTGTVVESSKSPSGFAFEAKVGHFSWWNCDVGFMPFYPKPMPKLRDENGTPNKNLPGGENVRIRGEQVQAGGPQNAAETTVPPSGATEGLPVPANRDVRLTGFARNGLLRGEVTVNGKAGKDKEVIIPLDPIDSGGMGEMLSLPTDKDAAIMPKGETDRYEFSASKGDFVRISVSQLPSSNLEGTVSLYKSGGIRLAVRSFDYQEASILKKLPASGDYVIKIDATANAPGGYNLTVNTLPGVQLDTNIKGTFASGEQSKIFAFEAKGGTHVAIGAKDRYATTPRVKNPDGSIVAGNFGDPYGELKRDGVYMLEIENKDVSSSNPTLAYEVGLAKIDPPKSLSFSTSRATASGSIKIRGDRQVYKFTAKKGAGLAVTLDGKGSNALPDDKNSKIQVGRVGNGSYADPQNGVRNSARTTQLKEMIDIHSAALTYSGQSTYVVTVSSRALGDYELVVDAVSPGSQVKVDDDAMCSNVQTKSLPAALHAVDKNGTVTVCKGAYRSEVPAYIETDGVTVSGTSRSGVVIETRHFQTLEIKASDVTFENLTIEEESGAAVVYSGDNLVFEKLDVKPSSSASGFIQDGIAGGGANPTFRKVDVSKTRTAITVNNASTKNAGTLEDCVISESKTGFDLRGSGAKVRNNDIGIARNSKNNTGMELEGASFTVENNKITVDLKGGSYNGGTGINYRPDTSSMTTSRIGDNHIEFVGGHKLQDNWAIQVSFKRQSVNANVVVENNEIILKPINGGTAFQINTIGTSTVTVQNNVVQNLGHDGIELLGASDANHVGLYNNTFQMASSNTFSNPLMAIKIQASSNSLSSLPIEIVNNIFDGNGIRADAAEFTIGANGRSIDSDYNLWYQFNSTNFKNGSSSTGNNTITGKDPQLQSMTLKPKASSPAVDAGAGTSNYSKLPGNDYSGTSRPAGSGYDIGAHEQ